MHVVRLTEAHGAALEELLLLDPPVNLFLLGYLDAVPVPRAWWYGALDGDRVVAAALLVPGRLVVPFSPDPAHATALGRALGRRHRPCMMVGPRAACDALWAPWGRGARIDRWHDQRLYVCDTHALPERDPLPGFRRAHPDDFAEVLDQAAAMEVEDIGRFRLDDDPDGFREGVRRRIQQGQTWVVERDGALVFQIHVGTETAFGCQVGGTYVPPAHRGQGLATAGMLELGRRLRRRHKRITLHVNEANAPAVRVYERSGYRPHAPFRLVTLAS